jgi:peptide/nickel transport system substrate-binding protein
MEALVCMLSIVYGMGIGGKFSFLRGTRGDPDVRIPSRMLALLLAMGLLLAACGDDDEDSPEAVAPTGDVVTIALGSEPTSLDPHLVDDGGERAVNDNIYETLLVRDAEGELGPGLAVDMPEQVDDTTWQFALREGITFHNGEPFNADAVVASVERMIRLMEEDVTDQAGFFASLAGAEAVDEYTVNVMTSGADGVLPSRMYWLKMIPATVGESDDLSADPVGTGPYRFVEFVRGSHVTIEANADYWNGAPEITNVRYQFVEESGARLAGLLAGEYDVITNLQPEDVDRAPQAAQQRGQEHPLLILNATGGITEDPRVREALNLAVDENAIVENLFGGYASIDNCQLLSPSILGHNTSLSAFGHDMERAKELLEEAGATGGNITLVGTAGRWLKDRELVEAVGGFWTEAGLNVDVQILEFGAYLDVLFDRQNRADAIFVSSSNDLLDPDRQLSTFYHRGGIGASNDNADLAQLVEDARSTLDEDERAELYNEAVKLACDEAYFVFLVNNDDIYGLSDRMVWTPRVDSKILLQEMSIN